MHNNVHAQLGRLPPLSHQTSSLGSVLLPSFLLSEVAKGFPEEGQRDEHERKKHGRVLKDSTEAVL